MNIALIKGRPADIAIYHIAAMSPGTRRWLVWLLPAVAVVIGIGAAAWLIGKRTPPPELPDIVVSFDPAEVDPAIAWLIEYRISEAKQEPSDAMPRARLAMAFAANAMHEAALAMYQQTISMERNVSLRAVLWFLQAFSQAERGEIAAALTSIDESIRLIPDHAPSHWQRGIWLLDMDRLDDANAAFAEAARLDPSDVAARVGLARVHLLRGESEAAANILKDLLSNAGRGGDGQLREPLPNEAYIRMLLGSAHRDSAPVEIGVDDVVQDRGSATAWPNHWLDELASMRTGYRAELEKARTLAGAGQPVAALSILEALLREHPNDVRALNYYASAADAAGQREAALFALQRALEIEPESSLTHLILSQLHEHDDLVKSLHHAEMAVEYNALSGAVHRQLGRVLAMNNRPAEAADVLLKAVQLGAHDWETRLLLGRTLNESSQPVEAERVLRVALESAPDSAGVCAALARSTAEQGRLDEAHEWLERARQLDPNEMAIPFVAARLIQLQGEQATPPRPPSPGPSSTTSP